MLIGVPKEIKDHEYRVGLTPESVNELVRSGHRVFIEPSAGEGIGANDVDYTSVGGELASVDTLFESAELIIKVKEPQAEECARLRPEQALFTYLHLAADPGQTQALIASGALCIAYETVTSAHGGLPLLAPMSEIAGRLSIQAAAHCLERVRGGRGMLLGGVPGVEPAKVVIIGGGMVGTHAAQVAIGMGASTYVIDRSNEALRQLWRTFGHSLRTVYSTQASISRHLQEADVVIGGVLVPGAAAPKLITAEHVQQMNAGAVIVDVAIDQGGCCETSHPTTHSDPTFLVDNVVHYCVANMPGAVPRTSTYALNNATMPYVLALANQGCIAALSRDPHLRAGLNVCRGQITQAQIAAELGYAYRDSLEVLSS